MLGRSRMKPQHKGREMKICQAAPQQAATLLQQSHAMMARMYAPEDNHALDLNALAAPDIRFFIAVDGDQVLACGAVKLAADYAEVKSLFTDPAARGRGAAYAILTAIEAKARDHNLPFLRLETGVGLDAAAALYRRFGFYEIGAFGDYPSSPASVFFEKPLG